MPQGLEGRSDALAGGADVEIDGASDELSTSADWFSVDEDAALDFAVEDRESDDGIVVARHRSLIRWLILIALALAVCGGVGWLVWSGYRTHLDTQARLLDSMSATQSSLQSAQEELARLRALVELQDKGIGEIRRVQGEQSNTLDGLKNQVSHLASPSDTARR